MAYIRPLASEIETFPPIYKAAYLRLLDDYDNPKKDKISILREFSQKYVLISHFWNDLNDLELKCGGRIPNLKGIRKCLFFSSIKYGYSWDLKWSGAQGGFCAPYYYIKFPSYKRFESAIKIMSLPNAFAANALRFYQNYGTKPLPKAVIQKSERAVFLYDEFMKKSSTNEKLFNYLNEIEEEDVVIGILEHRLGWKMGCVNKSIWKFYIDFLQNKKDHFALLDVYQRYTRFFIEDIEMNEKYRNEIQRIGETHAVSEFWIDTILFHFDFGTCEKVIQILEKAIACTTGKSCKHFSISKSSFKDWKEIMDYAENDKIQKVKKNEPSFIVPLQNPISKYYYPKDDIQKYRRAPKFALPSTCVHYIYKTANYETLQKLFNTCKYFFAMKPTLICYRLIISASKQNSTKFIHQSLYICKDFTKYHYFKGLVVTKQLLLLGDGSDEEVGKIMSKITENEIINYANLD